MKPQPISQTLREVLYRAWTKGFIAGMWYGGITTLIITILIFKLTGWW